MGKGELAIRIANWFLEHPDCQLAAIVPMVPEPSWAPSFMTWGKAQAGLTSVIESGQYADLPGVRDEGWTIDLVFSVFYDRIIKEWFIKKCRRILNVHNGPLPRYRGVSPINWALKNGETEHGVAIHEITPGIDDGPIVSHLNYSTYPDFDEVIDVYQRSLEYAWVLFQQTMPILEKITPRQQSHSMASYYSKEQDGLLMERRDFTKAKSLTVARSAAEAVQGSADQASSGGKSRRR